MPDLAEPPGVVLTRGRNVEHIVVAASRILHPWGHMGEHVQAFRLMFFGGPERATRIPMVWAPPPPVGWHCQLLVPASGDVAALPFQAAVDCQCCHNRNTG